MKLVHQNSRKGGKRHLKKSPTQYMAHKANRHHDDGKQLSALRQGFNIPGSIRREKQLDKDGNHASLA